MDLASIDVPTLYEDDPRELLSRLSRRELQCSQLRCSGHTLEEIAQKLGIDYHTAKNHVAAALKRLGADSMDQICYSLGRCDERILLFELARRKNELKLDSTI